MQCRGRAYVRREAELASHKDHPALPASRILHASKGHVDGNAGNSSKATLPPLPGDPSTCLPMANGTLPLPLWFRCNQCPESSEKGKNSALFIGPNLFCQVFKPGLPKMA